MKKGVVETPFFGSVYPYVACHARMVTFLFSSCFSFTYIMFRYDYKNLGIRG